MNPANPPDRPAGKLSGRTVAFILAVVFGSLTLWSLCAGFAYLAVQQSPPVLQPAGLGLPTLAGRPNPNDWWTSRVLSQVYTVALDRAASNQEVIDLLGETIEADALGDDLYRRSRTGTLNPQSETIAFEITGPKGTATVTVVAATPEQSLQIHEITVTAPDGTTIRVPPPDAEPFSIR